MRLSDFPQNPGYYLRRIAFYVKNGETFRIVKTLLTDTVMPRLGRAKLLAVIGETGFKVSEQTNRAVAIYVPKTYPSQIVLFVPEKRLGFPNDPRVRIDPWRRFATGQFDAHIIPGEHLASRNNIFKEPNVQVMARQLSVYLDKASAENPR